MDATNLRTADRYVTREPLTGSFGAVPITVVNLGAEGAQIRHTQSLRLGTKARFWFREGDQQVTAQAIIVWSHLSKHLSMDGRVLYDSGVRVEDGLPAFRAAVEALVTDGFCRPDVRPAKRKPKSGLFRWGKRVLEPVATPPPDVSSDAEDLIQHARDRMNENPDEARKWLQRAKFSLTQSSRTPGVRHRDDVLAVWEYLERSVDLVTIARVIDRKP